MTIRLVFIACLLVTAVCNAATIEQFQSHPTSHLVVLGLPKFIEARHLRLPSGPAALANSLTVFVRSNKTSALAFMSS